MTTLLQFPILAAVLGELGFIAINIVAKRLRGKGVTGKAVLAVYGLTLPVWFAALVYFGADINLPWPYLLCLAVWLGLSYFLTIGTSYVSAFQSLGEGTGYRFGFSVILALLVDCVVFKTAYGPATTLAIALFVAGGALLHVNRLKQDFHQSKLVKLHYRLAFVLLVALAEVGAYALFKYAVTFQGSVFAHNAVFQAVLAVMFLIGGGRILLRDTKQGAFPVCYIAIIAVLFVIAASANAVAIAALPVTLFIMFSLIRAAFFAAYDAENGAAKGSPATAAGIVLIAAGVIATAMIQGF